MKFLVGSLILLSWDGFVFFVNFNLPNRFFDLEFDDFFLSGF